MREKINAKVLFDEDGWLRLQAEVPKVGGCSKYKKTNISLTLLICTSIYSSDYYLHLNFPSLISFLFSFFRPHHVPLTPPLPPFFHPISTNMRCYYI